jgi:hydrogenase maturation protease
VIGTPTAHVLIAGVGNIFMSDDGFGSAVVDHLLATELPDDVRAVDYGIRGMHLAFDLSAEVATLILVDTVEDAGGPGGVVVVEVDTDLVATAPLDAHSMDPDTVLHSVVALADELPRTLVVGCQPASLEEGIGLTPVVTAAVPVAADNAVELARRELDSLKGAS